MNNLALKNDSLFTTHVKLSKTSLEMDENTTFEEWSEIGEKLQDIQGSIHWWIGDWISFGEHKWGEKYTQAIEKTGYVLETLKTDVWVANSIKKSLRNDNLSFTHHHLVASLEPKDQEKWLDKAEKEELSTRELKATIRKYKHKNMKQPPLPEGKYNIIYADPPWQYEHPISDSRKIENKYPTMELEEIKKLKIPAADDSILFLWTPASLIKHALEVMETWGFNFRTTAIWDKEVLGMGYWFRTQHEILLIGIKGNFHPPEPELRVSSLHREKRGKHSQKPKYYYEVIEWMYPKGKYLELFAREARKGWNGWGNEL